MKTEDSNPAVSAEESKPNQTFLNYMVKKTEIWSQINYLEKGYNRLRLQINQLEKDKKDMSNTVRELLNELQKLHDKNLTI